ncbi:hypothetical protein D7030_07595 [Flavobacteriaceae bacterium AU392]|nr:hypothetical protein D1817_00825 [Flavobacteriaceae bacterium]RKM84986.1 hypothetical protein D7030_07595 [Flavobacteriaceae bacterium AU392]
MFSISSYQINAQDIKGSWKGTLNVQGTELPILFHISEKEGVYTTTMDSPSQGATDIPMDKTTYQDGALTITLAQAGIKYVATLKEDKITGTFYQSGYEFPLIMKLEKKE